MIVALTGGTGFLGNHVLEATLEHGHRIRALTRRSQPPRDGVEWIPGSLEDYTALARMCHGADAVIHVAGVVSAPDAAGFDRGNRAGTVAVIEAAKAAGVTRFVHVSSLTARQPQLSMYGASKLAGEQVAAASGLDVRIVRPPGIFGPGDTETLDLFRMAGRGLALLPPRGRGSWIYAGDMAELIVALAEADIAPALVEADDGREGGWTHAAFAEALAAALGRRGITSFHAPAWLLRLAARADEAVRGKAAKLTADRAGYLAHPDWTIDPALRPPTALWMPRTPTAIGLARTADWYRARSLI
ncbi:NAD(P)-binding domain-containing protein [Sphingomonas antarctica]|uniref:NAD-dependent epimerase/dehydratase family protein n=1 Tax=Sphingomonas antarctica TaxID=2040274 RepID=UPI0039E97E7A